MCDWRIQVSLLNHSDILTHANKFEYTIYYVLPSNVLNIVSVLLTTATTRTSSFWRVQLTLRKVDTLYSTFLACSRFVQQFVDDEIGNLKMNFVHPTGRDLLSKTRLHSDGSKRHGCQPYNSSHSAYPFSRFYQILYTSYTHN
jgi:hypothetical protein